MLLSKIEQQMNDFINLMLKKLKFILILNKKIKRIELLLTFVKYNFYTLGHFYT